MIILDKHVLIWMASEPKRVIQALSSLFVKASISYRLHAERRCRRHRCIRPLLHYL